MTNGPPPNDGIDYWLIGIFVALALLVVSAFAYAVYAAPVVMAGVFAGAFGVLFVPYVIGRGAVWLFGDRNL